MMLTRKVFAAGALAILMGFPISGVLAQSSSSMSDSSGAAASAPAAQPAAQVDDATLQKAARAYVKVKQIVHQSKQASAPGTSAHPDPAAAQSEKISAVKNAGLEPQEYNQVLQMVQNDPQLQQKFANYVNQNGGDSD